MKKLEKSTWVTIIVIVSLVSITAFFAYQVGKGLAKIPPPDPTPQIDSLVDVNLILQGKLDALQVDYLELEDRKQTTRIIYRNKIVKVRDTPIDKVRRDLIDEL